MSFHKRHPPAGARPGTLVLDPSAPPPRITVTRYREEAVLDDGMDVDTSALPELLAGEDKIWIDVQGLGDKKVLRELARIVSIHPLALEDVVNTPQRPKAESYEHHALLVTRMLRPAEGGAFAMEQVSVFVGGNYVLSFQEHYGDVLEPVRERLRRAKGPIRRLGPDYLAYALIDTIVDAYYPVVEAMGERLEELESRVMASGSETVLAEVNRTRRELLTLRRVLWPQRDALSALVRGDSPFVGEEVGVFLRDTHDHCVQLADVIETHRELAGGLFNTYLSVIGQRTNEVMKVLTIMASIFIPLTFMAGLYGMNFEHMPELHYRYSYPLLLASMVVVGAAMLAYFRRKGWIGGRSRDASGPADSRRPLRFVERGSSEHP